MFNKREKIWIVFILFFFAIYLLLDILFIKLTSKQTFVLG